jgi:hypothetical protein
MPPVCIARDLSRAQAEVLRGVLEAAGVTVVLSQEAVGSVMPLDVGAFGQVDILVPAGQAALAREVLDEIPGQMPVSDDDG